jgi:hypothetical protein
MQHQHQSKVTSMGLAGQLGAHSGQYWHGQTRVSCRQLQPFFFLCVCVGGGVDLKIDLCGRVCDRD